MQNRQVFIKSFTLPEAVELNRIFRSGGSLWLWLAGSAEGRKIFVDLLDQGILPTPEALSSMDIATNTNTWFQLATSERGRGIFYRLLKLDIYPSNQALDEGRSTWEQLKESKRIDFMGSPYSYANLIIQHLKKNFRRFKNSHPNKMTILLSRENLGDFYGFLYLFYQLPFYQAELFFFPLEIWIKIGKNLLPWVNDFTELMKVDNQTTFVKWYMDYSLYGYSNRFFSIFNSNNYRAEIFRDAICTVEEVQDKQEQNEQVKNPLQKLLIRQYVLSQGTKPPYQNLSSIPEHEQGYDKKINNKGNYGAILRDGVRLGWGNHL